MYLCGKGDCPRKFHSSCKTAKSFIEFSCGDRRTLAMESRGKSIIFWRKLSITSIAREQVTKTLGSTLEVYPLCHRQWRVTAGHKLAK